MTKTVRLTSDIFNQYEPFFVGFDRVFDQLSDFHFSQNTSGGYPPYNVIKKDDNKYSIEIAVAGFSMDDLDIVHDRQNSLLKVEGNSKDAEDQYVHKGIAARQFNRSWNLHEAIEITNASLDNGMLVIDLEHIIPDELKPKKIQINTTE